jgi:hypothetical protein
MRHTLTTLGIVIAATTMSGCAFGTRHVNLTYAPGLGATPAGTSSSGRVAVAKFEDARNRAGHRIVARQGSQWLHPDRIGAPLLESGDVGGGGVARALTAQGLTVERVSSVKAKGGRAGRVRARRSASGGMYASVDANTSADLAINPTAGDRRVMCNGQASKLADRRRTNTGHSSKRR